jgi:hypothetical protein
VPGERATGFFRLGTGLWLMYLVFAVALNFISWDTRCRCESFTRRG